MVHQEERHRRSGLDGSVPNFVRVKAERCKTPKEAAGVSKQVSDKGVTDLKGLAVESYQAHHGLLGSVRDCGDNPLDCWTPTEYRAEETVTGASLSSCIHLLPVLLVLEDDCDIVSQREQIRVQERENAPQSGAENNATHTDMFSVARASHLGVFAWSHCERECIKDQVSRVSLGRGSGILCVAGQLLEEYLEQYRGNGFLAFGRWICVIEGLQEGCDGGE
jgi:hypothetical protein